MVFLYQSLSNFFCGLICERNIPTYSCFSHILSYPYFTLLPTKQLFLYIQQVNHRVCPVVSPQYRYPHCYRLRNLQYYQLRNLHCHPHWRRQFHQLLLHRRKQVRKGSIQCAPSFFHYFFICLFNYSFIYLF